MAEQGFYDTEEEALAAAKARGHIDWFDGQNCDDCTGWDGESRRCDCGNRRVAWQTEHAAKGWYCYAEAY